MLFQRSERAVFLLLFLSSLCSRVTAAATAVVDGPEEFRAALLDWRVEAIVLQGAIQLPPHRDSTPRFLINRNVSIESAPGSMYELDFNHAAGCALVCSSCTITFDRVVVANAKRLQAVTFFRGAGPGSSVVFKDSYITQLACAPAAAGRSVLRDAPRSRQFPQQHQQQQQQQLLESTNATYAGRSYPGSIRALDVAVDLPLEVLEREIFTGGYGLLYENVTQLCYSSVPDSCLARSSLALCIEEQTRQLESGRAAAATEAGAAAVAVTSSSPQQSASFSAGAVAGAVVGAVAGTTLLLAACAAFVHARRRRAQHSKGGLSPPDSWMFILPSYAQQLQDERRRKLGWLSGLQAGSSSAGDSGDSGPPVPEPQGRGERLSAAITTKVLNIIEQRPFVGTVAAGDGAAGGSALRRGLSGGVVSDATGTDDTESELAPRSSGAGSRPVSLEEAEEDELQILRAIGRGGFGTVFKAIWHGATVAVKVVQLPPGSKAVAASESVTTKRRDGSMLLGLKDMRPAGASAIEDMAVQEAAIGSSMAHPNIVAVYSVLLKPMQQYRSSQLRMLRRASAEEQAEEPAAEAGRDSSDAADDTAAAAADTDTDLVPWEMQLIMEYCDQGTLRDVLDARLIYDRSTGANHIPTVLSLAQQVARAMQYLHKEHVLHGDLKASNVLLQSAVQFASFTGQRSPAVVTDAAAYAPLEGLPEQQQQQQQQGAAALPGCDLQWLALKGCTVTAKVSDFGLSTSLDPASTHITRRGPGTITHTAPETLVHGHCSRASDVYAYGMLLYELATGSRVFANVPQMLIGNMVVEQKVRPKWPAALTSNACWSGIIALVEICWQQNPHARPTFSEVLAELRSLARGNRVSLSITDRLHRAVSAAAAEAPAAAAPPPPAAEWRQDNSSGSHHQHASATMRAVAGVSSAAAHPLLYDQHQQQQGKSDDGCMVLQPLDNTAGSIVSTSTADGHQQPLLCVPESLLYQPSTIARRAASAADAAAARAIVLQPLDGTAEEPPGGGL